MCLGTFQSQGTHIFHTFSEPYMTKVTCFSAVLNGKTKYRRIRQ